MIRRYSAKRFVASISGGVGLLSSHYSCPVATWDMKSASSSFQDTSSFLFSSSRRHDKSIPSFLQTQRSFSTTQLSFARGSGRPNRGGAQEKVEQVANQLQQKFSPMFGGSSGSRGQSTADSLTPQVRAHMFRVYNLLAAAIAVAGCGSAAMFLTPLGHMVPWWLGCFGGLIPLFWLMLKPPATLNGQLALFFSFAALEGLALAPIVYLSMAKGVLGTALVLTAAVFGGFSAAALLAPRASLLVFQGPLFGMLIGMCAISVLNLFWPTAFAHSIVLYGGLAIFSMFVAVDTQAMIERARCGMGNHVMDALQMFLNVINIFVRIAAMLRGE